MTAPTQPKLTKDEIAVCMQMAEFRRQLREARHAREWRMVFAIWAALGGLILQANRIPVWAIALIAVSVAVFHWWICAWNFKKSLFDAAEMWRWIEKVEQRFDPDHKTLPSARFWSHGSNLTQMLITMALGIAAIAAHWMAPANEPAPPAGIVLSQLATAEVPTA